MDKIHELYSGTAHIAATVFLLCGLLLFMRRDEGERSRYILFWVYFIIGFAYAVRVVALYLDIPPIPSSSITMVLLGALAITTYTLYPIEVITPYWLRLPRMALVYVPFMLLFVVYIVSRLLGVEYHVFESIRYPFEHIAEFDVYFRFLIMAVTMAIPFIVFHVPHWRRCNNTNMVWVYTYVVLLEFICLFLVAGTFFDNELLVAFYQIVGSLIALYITYQELFVRLFIPDKESYLYGVRSSGIDDTLDEKTNKQLWDRVEIYMQREPVWHNPNFAVVMIADEVGANRSEISKLIKLMGYNNFDNYVAEFRIREFCTIIKNSNDTTIDDAFFKVGFRYRNIALKQFTRIMHQSPNEYILKNRTTTVN